jgi:hypothetical protein
MMRALIALIVAAAVAGGVYLWISQGGSGDDAVEAELAGAKFTYARAYARDEATAAGGLSDRLSFVVSFPKFAPLSTRARSTPSVTMTVTPKDEGLDPSDRPAKLYARFLSADATTGPGGLVLRRFEPDSPYDYEQLYVAPPDGRAFFARCPKAQTGEVPDTCLSIFRHGVFDVELRYAANLLEHWDVLYEGARGLLARMTGRPAHAKRPVTGLIPLRDRNQE